MTMEIRVPQLPESVADATLVAWRKQPGEAVSRDENLADLETDKVVLEVPAPAAGVIKEFKVAQGATVKSGDLLAIFEPGAAAAKPVPAASATAVAAAPAPSAAKSAAAEKLSPAVRRAVEESGVDPAAVSGSGRDGRLTKGDVLAEASKQKSAPAAAPAATKVAAKVSAVSAPPGPRAEQRVPMTRLRQRIAERLVQSQSTAAILTTFNEVNMAPVMALRKTYQERFEKVTMWFDHWGFWAVLVAGFSPVPYKIFTISAGVLNLALLPFVLASIRGRGARFFLVAWCLATYGPTIESKLVRYIEYIGWAIVGLLSLAIAIYYF